MYMVKLQKFCNNNNIKIFIVLIKKMIIVPGILRGILDIKGFCFLVYGYTTIPFPHKLADPENQ